MVSAPRTLTLLLLLAACVPEGGGGDDDKAPPEAPSISIGPTHPRTTDTLVAVISGPDPALTYTYRWLRDGLPQDELTAEAVPADLTTKGQLWAVEVRAVDGELLSPVSTASTTILNAPPEVTVTLSPAAPVTGDAIRANTHSSDPDGDPVSLQFAWTLDLGPDDEASDTIAAARTARGQRWAVEVTPSDGDDSGAPARAELTVGNAAPVLTRLSLEPAAPRVTDDLSATVEGVDLDGDALTMRYRFMVDGADVQDGPSPVLPAGVARKGQEVSVEVIANDGLVDSAPLLSSGVRVLNTAPVGAGAVIEPLPVREASEVWCRAAGFTDADADAEGWVYSWRVNGVEVSGTEMIDGALFARGDTLSCTATPDDGAELGAPLSAPPVEVQNSPPTLASASLSTLSPTEASTLTVSLGAVADEDGDAVSLRYLWSVNGSPAGAGSSLSGADFAKGDLIEVMVTPHDGTDAGLPVRSATALAVNTPPVMTAAALSPTSVTTDATLSASASAADADGDPLTFSYAWRVDGVLLGSATGSSLSGALAFDKDEVVEVVVTPFDGEESGAPLASAGVLVQNSPPTAPTLSVGPAEPGEGDPLTCNVTAPASDPDGDGITYRFSWTVDGAPYGGAVDGVEDSVVDGADVEGGDLWACTALASDGTDAASATALRRVNHSCGTGVVIDEVAGMSLVGVCAQTFTMGCPSWDYDLPWVCDWDEIPSRRTTLTRDFAIGETEVTQGQFLAVVGRNPSVDTSCGLSCPVESLSWLDAIDFVNALSTAEGLEPCYPCTGAGTERYCGSAPDPYACEGYRLPTEAEWEAAARCGASTSFAGSDDPDPVAWTTNNSGGGIQPVATLAPNACGLYDMSGNVSEWTNDWLLDFYYALGPAIDPFGPPPGGNIAYRGGSWALPPVPDTYRNGYARSSRPPDVGVRIARTLP